MTTKNRFASLAFTLIELLIVITILGVLVAWVGPRLAGRTEQARKARAQADIQGISLALDTFELDTGKFPTEEEGLSILRDRPTDAESRNWHGPYLKRDPIDPWKREYHYRVPGTQGPDYDLFTLGPDGVEGTGDDIGNWEKK